MTKAIRIHQAGGPEVLKYEDVDIGDVGPDEVRLKHTAIGLNYIDVYQRSGMYPIGDLPKTLGMEAAGVVESVGSKVTRFAPGDRVLALPFTGAFAEAALAGEDSVFKIPDAMDFVTAAGFAVTYGTAQGALDWRADLQPGELLLVHGAAGGAGLAAAFGLALNAESFASRWCLTEASIASRARPGDTGFSKKRYTWPRLIRSISISPSSRRPATIATSRGIDLRRL